MADRVLVAYASRHGSTRQVAEAVARRLETHAVHVEVRPAADVRSLAEYDAVVLGAALYTGRMVVEARRFLRRHHTELSERPVAVYAMGPLTMSDEDVAAAARQLEEGLARVPALHPLTSAIFGGVVDPAQLHFPFSRMKASDARDWRAIDGWSDAVAELLRARSPAAASA
jgi:menaquinone-dependent protoporphyrinogen oxidase